MKLVLMFLFALIVVGCADDWNTNNNQKYEKDAYDAADTNHDGKISDLEQDEWNNAH